MTAEVAKILGDALVGGCEYIAWAGFWIGAGLFWGLHGTKR